MRLARLACVAAAALAVAAAAGSAAPQPALRFRVHVYGVPRPTSLVWTGSRFLIVQNTANTIWSAPAAGAPLRRFASMPKLVEEARCALSPGAHGFPRGALFCHAPNHAIYEFSASGRRTLFATLPVPATPADDGAVAFDTVGRFGYRLLAATGRSGAGRTGGGALYAIDARGAVDQVAAYPGPGGADELAVAPPTFGSAGGDALLTVDPGSTAGSLVAVAPDGRVRALASFPDGPNPIVVLRSLRARRGAPAPGLYVADDETPYVYYASAAPLSRYDGDVLVGTEGHALFWVVAPRGGGYRTIPVGTNLRAAARHSLEAMIEVG
jgi:hypothetical protein